MTSPTTDLDGIRALLALSEAGSVSSAARALGISRATLRRRLDGLESGLSVPLYSRADDAIALTPSGEVLAERGRALLSQLDEAVRQARLAGGIGRPHLRMLLQSGLGPNPLAAGLMMVSQQLPDVQLDVRFSDSPLDDAPHEADIIAYIGPPPAEGRFIVRAILRIPEQLLATPGYLRQHGAPATLEELGQHRLLSWQPHGEPADQWPLRGGGHFEAEPFLVSRDIHLVRQIALSGGGIARMPSADRVPDFGWGDTTLQPVLPEQFGRPFALRLLLPAQSRSPHTRRLAQLVEQMVAIAELSV